MSLENEIKKNTVALIELTNALAANEKGTTAPKPAQASPAASAPTPAIPADVLDDVPAAEPVAAAVTAPPTNGPATGEVVDKKQIIAAVIKLGQTKGRDPAFKVLADFGLSKASETTDDNPKNAELLAALQAALTV